MQQYLIAGVVIGCVYAIASSALVLTYQSSGILNFGFGGIAFFVARFFSYLNTDHGWSTWLAAVVSIGVCSPLLGVALYFLLFRYLRTATSLVKIVATVGLGVALPPVAYLLFGIPVTTVATGLAPEPVASYSVFGASVTLNQLIVVICLVLILALGYAVMRFTDFGLVVRATVDSPALTSLRGANPGTVALVVSIATTFLAGLCGVLLAPLVSLDPAQFNILITSAFTAVLLAKLVRVGRAIVVSIGLGVAAAIAEDLLPPTSPVTSGIIAAMPFIFVLAFLLWQARHGEVAEEGASAGKLDAAIATSTDASDSAQQSDTLTLRLHFRMRRTRLFDGRAGGGLAFLLIVAGAPLVLPDFWTQQVGLGLCFAVIFLSFTLVIGEGGMIWLCEAAFAGLGAVFTAKLATDGHVPVMLALLAAALLVAPIGLVLGLLTTRLGDLYVVLATLAFGVLVDNMVFVLPTFSGVNSSGTGVAVPMPSFVTGSSGFVYLVLAIFVVIALFIEHFRRSTAGLAMAAVRWSTRGARSTGVSVSQTKVFVSTVAASVAAVGGGLLAMYQGDAVTSSFATANGIVWLAVLATVGIRSNVAAGVAGLAFAVGPALFQTYLPLSLAQVPPAVFGLGAIMLVRNPDGVVAMHARQIRQLLGARLGPDQDIGEPAVSVAEGRGTNGADSGVADSVAGAAGVHRSGSPRFTTDRLGHD
jgi:branched-chain amino acid transport system permease protein